MKYCSMCGTRKDLNVHQRLDGRKALCNHCSGGTAPIPWSDLTSSEKVHVADSRLVHLDAKEKASAGKPVPEDGRG